MELRERPKAGNVVRDKGKETEGLALGDGSREEGEGDRVGLEEGRGEEEGRGVLMEYSRSREVTLAPFELLHAT